MTEQPKQYKSFSEFYPFYLSQHSNETNRKLHFIGTTFSIICWLLLLFTFQFKYFLMAPLFGYGFAWIGHFFFEKNKPATFIYPFYSLFGDFIMYYSILTGKINDDFKKYGITSN